MVFVNGKHFSLPSAVEDLEEGRDGGQGQAPLILGEKRRND